MFSEGGDGNDVSVVDYLAESSPGEKSVTPHISHGFSSNRAIDIAASGHNAFDKSHSFKSSKEVVGASNHPHSPLQRASKDFGAKVALAPVVVHKKKLSVETSHDHFGSPNSVANILSPNQPPASLSRPDPLKKHPLPAIVNRGDAKKHPDLSFHGSPPHEKLRVSEVLRNARKETNYVKRPVY